MGAIKYKSQTMMRHVLYALLPIVVVATYFFGLRVLLLTLVTGITGFLTELVFEWKRSKTITESVFVTTILFTLTLPPTTPFWIAILGVIFGLVFGKLVFGGFGRNVFNPALVGRAFVYVCFPYQLTQEWVRPIEGLLGGFTSYLGPLQDTISSATPMLAFRSESVLMPLPDLLLGNISGSIGETSAILILLAGAYLVYKKFASWQIMVSVVLGYLLLSVPMYLMGFESVINPLYGIFSGGLLFGAVFMATDPISSAKTKEGKWIYGILIGMVTVIIRGFALFAGGIMFAILIGNTFAPIIDIIVKEVKKGRKVANG